MQEVCRRCCSACKHAGASHSKRCDLSANVVRDAEQAAPATPDCRGSWLPGYVSDSPLCLPHAIIKTLTGLVCANLI
jgi:hypothetical protein